MRKLTASFVLPTLAFVLAGCPPPTGGDGQPCEPDDACNAGLTCVDGTCSLDDEGVRDAGTASPDGGPESDDAGSLDGGSNGADGGNIVDGGHVVDAGTIGDGGRTTDAGVDSGRLSDAGVDGGHDAGPPVCDGGCVGLTQCAAGNQCISLPSCADAGSACRDGEVCRNAVCVDENADPDEDGTTAATDCDEANPLRYPGAPEVCNGVDDNCSGASDEVVSDAGPLCANDPLGDVCVAGTCECTPVPADVDANATCETAIDLGLLYDSGTMQNVVTNVPSAGGDLWVRFRGVDQSDYTTRCDNFHVSVRMIENLDSRFAFDVRKGGCGNPIEVDGPLNTIAPNAVATTYYNDFRDFRATIDGVRRGQCPCNGQGSPDPGLDSCNNDDSADYFVRIFRVDPADETCVSATVEFSNGIYDTP